MKTPDLIIPHLDLIEKRLHEIIPPIDEPHSILFEAARYSLLLPAKRFRPLLILSVLDDFESPIEWGIDPACSLEMVHTYSLIHDDLPCMDDDDLRRGSPTLHKVYSEAQAVLAGDYLLTYAFEVLSNAPYLSAEKKVALIRLLSNRSGGDGMIGGQIIDILHEGKKILPETLKLMFAKKTAALIATALEFGGLIANLSAEDTHHLCAAGYALGIGYQYIDDILDLIGEEVEIGKPVGSDFGNDKAGALSLYSTDEAQEKAQSYYRKAVAELELLSRPTPQILSLFEKCFYRAK